MSAGRLTFVDSAAKKIKNIGIALKLKIYVADELTAAKNSVKKQKRGSKQLLSSWIELKYETQVRVSVPESKLRKPMTQLKIMHADTPK